MTFTHRELCFKAAKYLKNKGIQPFHKCHYVVCDFERIGECPDAYGFGSCSTQLIEVKVSRADFLSDKHKPWRREPERGLGRFRSYMCPSGVIKPSDIPVNWGLLWVDETGKIEVKVKPEFQESDQGEEMRVLLSILRRENVKPQIFSYKKCANDTTEIISSPYPQN
jgi:hypothetical protein